MLCDSSESWDELRWEVVKAMLDEFPKVKLRAKAYLEKS
jgi:hypothetical protein